MTDRLRGLITETERLLFDLGRITKRELDDLHRPTREEYAELKRYFARKKNLRPGAQGIGGWEVKQGGKEPPPVPPIAAQPVEPWEQETVLRLQDLLQHEELEQLLGNALLYILRRVRQMETGEDRRGRKAELAQALLIRHGRDLFADPQVRTTVAKRCGVPCPGKWVAGKAAAHEFVRAAGFSTVLAGIPTENPPVDYEYLEGRVALKELQPFQVEVRLRLTENLLQGRRGLVTLPTGAGKTRVAVEAIRDWLTKYDQKAIGDSATVLWLAHSAELCEQAYTEFRQVWMDSSAACPLLLIRFWGQFTQDLIKHRKALRDILRQPSVLVSTPQRIGNLLEAAGDGAADVLRDIKESACLLVVDEAHRAAAPTYRQIMGTFGDEIRPFPIIGLTATPFRMEYVKDAPEAETRVLASIFANNLILAKERLGEDPEKALAILQGLGVLARVIISEIDTGTTLKIPFEPTDPTLSTADTEERIDNALRLRADNPQRRLTILRHIQPLCEEEKHSVLYFGPSIGDAECMAFLLRDKKIPAAFVSGDTREATRRELIRDFKARKIRVLCNCEVLTTGFDAPQVTHVVVARPTVSQVLYQQMVGRGLRGPEFGGTSECVIVNCKDKPDFRWPKLAYEGFLDVWRPERRAAH
jgi:superfamily II DNA or RNA helicase